MCPGKSRGWQWAVMSRQLKTVFCGMPPHKIVTKEEQMHVELRELTRL